MDYLDEISLVHAMLWIVTLGIVAWVAHGVLGSFSSATPPSSPARPARRRCDCGTAAVRPQAKFCPHCGKKVTV